MSIATLLGMLVWPVSASAGDQPAAAYWMAAASNSTTVQWGRLVLKDGMLTFHTTHGDWTTPLHEIKRIVRVKGANHTFEVVTASGATLQLSILGPRMLPESPQKAMQMIQSAVRKATPPPAPVMTMTASAGSIRH